MTTLLDQPQLPTTTPDPGDCECGRRLDLVAPGVWGCRACHHRDLAARAAAGRADPGPLAPPAHQDHHLPPGPLRRCNACGQFSHYLNLAETCPPCATPHHAKPRLARPPRQAPSTRSSGVGVQFTTPTGGRRTVRVVLEGLTIYAVGRPQPDCLAITATGGTATGHLTSQAGHTCRVSLAAAAFTWRLYGPDQHTPETLLRAWHHHHTPVSGAVVTDPPTLLLFDQTTPGRHVQVPLPWPGYWTATAFHPSGEPHTPA